MEADLGEAFADPLGGALLGADRFEPAFGGGAERQTLPWCGLARLLWSMEDGGGNAALGEQRKSEEREESEPHVFVREIQPHFRIKTFTFDRASW